MKTDRRYGPKIIIDNISGSIMRIQTLIEKTIHIAGAQIFNSMPHNTSHNLDSNLKMSNSLIVWNENMNTVDWVPEAQSDESGDMLQ